MNNTNTKPHTKDKFQKHFGAGGHSWFITCCLYCIAGKRGHLTCITLQRLGRKGGQEKWLSWEQHHWSLARAGSPSPVQHATALGQHWAEVPFYKSKEPPKPVFLMSKEGS